MPAIPAPWDNWSPPEVTLPDPNAFDTYLRVHALIGETDDRLGWPCDPMAVEQLELARDDPWRIGPPELPLQERLAPYAPVLQMVREALEQDCRIPPGRGPSDEQPDRLFRLYVAVGHAARLLAMESRLRLDAGDPEGAASSALDCLALAPHVASCRQTVPSYIASAILHMALPALDEAAAPLDADGCRKALRRLRQIESFWLPVCEVVAEEATLTRLYIAQTAAEVGGPHSSLLRRLAAPLIRPLARRFLLKQWRDGEALWRKVQEQTAQPYFNRAAPPAPKGMYLSTVANSIASLWLKDAHSQAALRLRQAQLAARCFALETGRLPQTLDELVPTYLPAVPGDPFGEGPLRAKLAEAALTIYSFGPDGRDDGGSPVQPPITADSPGDIAVSVALPGPRPSTPPSPGA